MFKVGDKILYPVHGAGIIEAIEEKEITGDKQLYYIINILHKGMKVMIPMEKTTHHGIRNVVEADVMEDVLTTFQLEDDDSSINHIQRHRVNINKLKSGDIYEAAEVIRELVRISKKKNLGTEDRNTLNNAQQIFLSEMVLVKEIEQDEAVTLLNDAINH